VPYIKNLECLKCGKTYPAVPDSYTCPSCGSEGILDVIYDYKAISANVSKEKLKDNKNYSMWRYLPWLPVIAETIPPLKVGWTPVYNAERLADVIGLKTLYVKDDGLNPTASLKDRASAVAVAKAVEAGADTIACSSTGNAASSLAGNAASVGLKSCIFVPGRAPQGKIAQLLIFGATVVSVQGSYEDAFKLSAEAIDRWGWYNRNAGINPYMVEGKKTVSMELCEQLNWHVPDWIVLSVGDGCTIGGAWKGLVDLYETGFIDRLPKVLGVQAEGCCPITTAFINNEPLRPSEENTLADSIAVGVPRNPDKALRAIRDSHGTMINVSDAQILEAMRLLGRTTGVFGEPAGVTGLAGIQKAIAEGIIHQDESVAFVVTGNGLKDVQNAIRAVSEPIKVPPEMDLLVKALSERG